MILLIFLKHRMAGPPHLRTLSFPTDVFLHLLTKPYMYFTSFFYKPIKLYLAQIDQAFVVRQFRL